LILIRIRQQQRKFLAAKPSSQITHAR